MACKNFFKIDRITITFLYNNQFLRHLGSLQKDSQKLGPLRVYVTTPSKLNRFLKYFSYDDFFIVIISSKFKVDFKNAIKSLVRFK